MKVLVAGGAGFIGSTIASACLDAGITPIVVDNLLTGRLEFVADRIFYEGDIADGYLIGKIFKEHPDIKAVVLCAALINVSESVKDPSSYFRVNVSKCLEFVENVLSLGCHRLIFSSSASIYRSSEVSPVNESSIIQPVSPYARTKVMSEWMFEDVSQTSALRVLTFRYFNPIGADPKMRSGLQLLHPTHALGRMIEAAQKGVKFEITGTDYATRDGTGIRDYVHVWDVARAHIIALKRFDQLVRDGKPFDVINLGTGTGTTVLELLTEFKRVSDVPLNTIEGPRRQGDSAGAFASFEKARNVLDWTPEFTLAEGIRDSIKWTEVRSRVLRSD